MYVITKIHNWYIQIELCLPPRCILFCWDIFTCFCKDGLGTLFRNKRFMLDEMYQQNASKFDKFLEYENPHSFFFHFVHGQSLMNPLVYVNIDQGIN